MINKLKKSLYLFIAKYFRFWAGIKLRRWSPRVVVVTGSSGKTTLLHMLESQLGDKAVYSHHANSAYGIPFFILDLHRETFSYVEWLKLFLTAPINSFKNPPHEKIFVAEADTDRWGEGKFLAEFLKPEVVLWTSVGRTHSQNFEQALKIKHLGFKSVDEAIAHDFGHFLERCQSLSVINADSEFMKKHVVRSRSQVIEVSKEIYLNKYNLTTNSTIFEIKGEEYKFSQLLPEEIFYSIVMCREVCGYLKLPFDKKFSRLKMPPGRSNILQGIKNTLLIDSSYNANLSSMKAVLDMFSKMPGDKKWVVLGDMLELGEKEREEHEKLGRLLSEMDLERIILVGKRVGEYTFQILDQRSKIKDQNNNSKIKNEKGSNDQVIKFSNREEVLDFIKENIRGGERILFKASASMYLEDIIESLLNEKKDADLLPRRGDFWDKKRRRSL